MRIIMEKDHLQLQILLKQKVSTFTDNICVEGYFLNGKYLHLKIGATAQALINVPPKKTLQNV